jgi:hypothetical protein
MLHYSNKALIETRRYRGALRLLLLCQHRLGERIS